MGLFCHRALIAQGYKKIVHLKGIDSLNLSQERARGFTDAFKKYRITIIKDQIIPTGFTIEDGMRVAEAMIESNDIPDAIFACNDLAAIGAMKVFKKNGYKIPTDIAFVGFTESKMVDLIDPPLTSVSQPTLDIGREAAKLLIEQIENKNTPFIPQTITLNGQLNIRESSVKI